MVAPVKKAAKEPPRPKVWMPDVGAQVTAYLPNETLRATVLEHLNRDAIVVCLDQQVPLAKSHNYRFRQKVVLHRQPSPPIGTRWEVDDEE